MISRHNTWQRVLAAGTLVFFVIGCSSREMPKAAEATRPAGLNEVRHERQQPAPRLAADEVSDIPGRIIVGILSAVAEPARDAQGRMVIVMPEMVNRSSAPNTGVIELGDWLRLELAQVGAASGMAFVDEAPPGGQTGGHYILEGEAYTVQRGGQRYWEVFFTLYDVDAATGAKHDRRWENARGYLVAR